MTSQSDRQREALLSSLSAPDIAHRIGEHFESKGKRVTPRAVEKWAAHWRAWKDFCDRERAALLPMTVPNVRQFLLEAIVSRRKNRSLAAYLESFELFHKVADVSPPWSEQEGADLLKILSDRYGAAVSAPRSRRHEIKGGPFPSSGLAHAEQLLAETEAAKRRSMRSEELGDQLEPQNSRPVDQPSTEAATEAKSPPVEQATSKHTPSIADVLGNLFGPGPSHPTSSVGKTSAAESDHSASSSATAAVAAFFDALLATATTTAEEQARRDGKELAAKARADFQAGGARRMRMLRLAAEELNGGDIEVVAQVLRGCLAGAGGLPKIAVATSVPLQTLKRAFGSSQRLSSDLARFLVLHLSRWT